MIWRRLACGAAALLLGFVCGSATAAESWVHGAASPGDFPLVQQRRAVPVVVAAEDFKVVELAAQDLAADIEHVTGRKPIVRADVRGLKTPALVIGTLGHSPLIDAWVSAGKLDVSALRGAWESFLIATVDAPQPGLPRALVIVGSDRRGTAFGAYELAQAIGVSPWHWWADVKPQAKSALFVAAGTRRFGPPSVKYRGIFLNDEDWGLQQWAAKTFEPENGGIGPKTYAKVFELLLRLKANTLWPAMHAGTRPFNSFAQNARLADDYAIVMGSSHAEPMLRNNVGEWTAPHEGYNYQSNRDGVLNYWRERAASNGPFENIYTLGMRGIHDSRMQGPSTDAERISLLHQVFADQRELIARHVRPPREAAPQMFCAYKEVLGLYRQGLKVPDDVTIVWPDDNFGYVRSFANAEERQRPGGFGVYYHLSYLGAPLSYLWLNTTPPALIWEEMSRSYEAGAKTIWIANVGDLKPAEIGMEFFLQMAWDIKRWQRGNLSEFLPQWAAREFGPAHAGEIASVMTDYYRLNFQRKPEHLQWWLPRETPRRSSFNTDEAAQRLQAFTQLRQRAQRLVQAISPALQDAFVELVGYPVSASALVNQRFLAGERGDAAAALAADAQLTLETRAWNEQVAGGKWRHMMALEPADAQWRSMRVAPWAMPPALAAAPREPTTSGGWIALEAEQFSSKQNRPGAAWDIIPGLGRSGAGSMALFLDQAAVPAAPAQIDSAAPRLDYALHFAAAGAFPLQLHLLPSHPDADGTLRLAIALDGGPPQWLDTAVRDGGAEWAQGVLSNSRVVTTTLAVPSAGPHTLHVYGLDGGVLLDKLVIDTGGLRPSYLGPPP